MPSLSKESQQKLYPPLEPFAQEMLQVSPLHTIYLEQSGNPKGIPILFVHGGPGGRSRPIDRQFFDPKKFRIILFDQRGSGKSKPFASIQDNTSWDLVEDMEKIRKHLNIDHWLLFGGSWGSTLSLLYAINYPEQTLAMILRGIFLASQEDLLWFLEGQGANKLFPKEWEDFLAPLPKGTQAGNIINTYYGILCTEGHPNQEKAAYAWAKWEASTLKLLPDKDTQESFLGKDLDYYKSLARIECHYFKHKSFLENNWILDKVSRIAHIPSVLVHGRYDTICPLQNAWKLHKRWKNSSLTIVEGAGHLAHDTGMTEALVEACDDLYQKVH